MDKFKRKKESEEKVRLEEAFEEFRETFEEGVVKVSKKFIRGDIVNANKTISTGKTGGGSQSVYKPSPLIQIKSVLKPSPTTAKKAAEETARKIMKEASTTPAGKSDNTGSAEKRPPKPGVKKVAEKSRLTNLEAFKEELKQMQAMRDERKGLRHHLKEKLGVPEEELDRIAPSLDAPYTGAGVPANVDFENDPSTTNLYVCNLPADAKIEDFFDTFGTFGPLASAKILYPKPDEERYRNTLSGFVAYMSRVDAERALCSMHGDVLRGCELRVSWARPVLIPPLPFYVPPPLRELAMPDPPSGLPFNAKPLSEDLRQFLRKYHDLPKLNAPFDAPTGDLANSSSSASSSPSSMLKDYKKMIENATVRVVVPTERPLLHLIHRVVEFLVRVGPLFEAVLMARERQNPMYRFLFDNHHPTHVYYRWRLYTVLEGDDRQKWCLDTFKMFEGGSWWQPPPHALFELGMPPQLYDTAYVPKKRRERAYSGGKRRSRRHASSDSGGSEHGGEEERSERKKRALKEELEREERQRKLRGILDEKEREELEELLRSLTPEKIAIGDAMIWCLDHAECSKEIAQCIYESFCIKETPLHKKIARIYLVSDILANCSVRVKDAFYYRQHFGDHLQKIFIELNETLESIESRLKTEQFRQRVMLCFRNWEDHSVYPTPELIQWQNIFLGLLKAGAEADSSIDGEPLPLEDDEEMADDLDGIPMDDEDLDGIPMAEEEQQAFDDPDLDGLPMEETATDEEVAGGGHLQQQQDNRFTTGSWSTIEPQEAHGKKGTPSNPTKSKWESIETNRWDQPANVSSTEFAAMREGEEEERNGPARKRHKISKLSPERAVKEETMVPGQGINGDAAAVMDEEERRRILRDIEVKVMKLQDELEADGAKQTDIDQEVAKYRLKLMAKMEEKLKLKMKSQGGREQGRRESMSNSTNGGKRRGHGGGHHSPDSTSERRNSISQEGSRRRDEERRERHRENSSERNRKERDDHGGGRDERPRDRREHDRHERRRDRSRSHESSRHRR